MFRSGFDMVFLDGENIEASRSLTRAEQRKKIAKQGANLSNAAKIQDALEKIENLIDCEPRNEDPRQLLRDIVVWIGEEIEAGIKLIHTSESALFTVADFRAIVC